MAIRARATIEDLYHVPEHGKAELVNGRLIILGPTGDLPSRASGTIWLRLYEHERSCGAGVAVGGNAGFVVSLPDRESFSPDAAFYVGPDSGMRFFEGAPVFAVEVRSEGDYSPKAERQMADKRADYFAAGTLVVWDVDLLSDDVIHKYSAGQPKSPTIFRRGEVADAEPAVPGWNMRVDDLFD